VAAEMAVETISEIVAKSDARQPVETLKSAIVQAGINIREQSEKQQSQKGMGATCACVWLIGDNLYTASVGDSRIYLIRNQTIRQLTIDHTWVQEAIDHGALTPEQARNHPNTHVIRRYLGSKNPVVPDVRLRLKPDEDNIQAERNQGTRIKPNDRLLLCSDGLTDLVSDSEICAALQTNQLEAALQYLITLANHRGGHDNITVVALDYSNGVTATARSSWVRPLFLACFGVFLVLLVALIAAALLGWYFTRPIPSPTPMGMAASGAILAFLLK
jgi:protein phosphatase